MSTNKELTSTIEEISLQLETARSTFILIPVASVGKDQSELLYSHQYFIQRHVLGEQRKEKMGSK